VVGGLSTVETKAVAITALSCEQVVSLMRAEGLGKYADLITENSVDGATMACMDTIQDVLDLELDDLKFNPNPNPNPNPNYPNPDHYPNPNPNQGLSQQHTLENC
jgi:hypothetical protein